MIEWKVYEDGGGGGAAGQMAYGNWVPVYNAHIIGIPFREASFSVW